MNTWKHRMAAAWFALGVLGLLVTVSTDARAQTPAVDPAAVQILKRMTDFLDGLQRFSVKTENVIEELHRFGAPGGSRPHGECDRQAAEQAACRAHGRIDGPALLL